MMIRQYFTPSPGKQLKKGVYWTCGQWCGREYSWHHNRHCYVNECIYIVKLMFTNIY